MIKPLLEGKSVRETLLGESRATLSKNEWQAMKEKMSKKMFFKDLPNLNVNEMRMLDGHMERAFMPTENIATQISEARSIGKVNIRKVKEIAMNEINAGNNDIDSIIQKIPEEMFDTWESAHDEIQRIITNVIFSQR